MQWRTRRWLPESHHPSILTSNQVDSEASARRVSISSAARVKPRASRGASSGRASTPLLSLSCESKSAWSTSPIEHAFGKDIAVNVGLLIGISLYIVPRGRSEKGASHSSCIGSVQEADLECGLTFLLAER
jgi:hypothetical protein